MSIEFRTPTIDDYETMIELWGKSDIPCKPEGRDRKENIEEELEKQPEYWIGAYDDDEMVGIIFGTDDGRKGWINRLAVAEDYRGLGIGKTLVEKLEEVFEEKGFKIWAALIEPDNPEGMDFFKEMGFEEGGIKYYSKRESDKV